MVYQTIIMRVCLFFSLTNSLHELQPSKESILDPTLPACYHFAII